MALSTPLALLTYRLEELIEYKLYENRNSNILEFF